MTDHFARPRRAASSERVAELHQLCDEDYAKGQSERAHANLAPSYAAISLTVRDHTPEPTDLDVAIRFAQQLLNTSEPQPLREALRLLLRALGAEPLTEDQAIRRSVDRAFPAVAEFLAQERGELQ